ncbi:MAG TPA: energy transducer TonB [Pyrinomonadaceae bacterium]
MKTKLSLLAFVSILLTFLPASAQQGPDSWKRYTVPKQEFSVALPTLPAMTYYPPSKDNPWQIMLGAYADGVIYVVEVHENMRGQQSLSDFIAEQTKNFELNDVTQKNLVVNGLAGKEYSLSIWRSQFFADRNAFYCFRVINAAVGHPGAQKFLSSIAFGQNQEGIAVTEGPGTPYQEDTDQVLYTGKDVDKKARLGMKPEPRYTEAARDNQVTGTVVLKVVFTSAGNVSNIRIVSALPDGLTENAVAAAKKIKFIPAMKDGHYVSMWMQLEYNFNLY